MKANVLEVKTQNEMSDIYAQKNGNMINFYSNKNNLVGVALIY